SKIWRWRYKLQGGTEKLLTIGHYPGVGLAEARTARDEANKIRREGHDPSVEKRLQKERRATRNGETFEIVARDWYARNQDRWSERHAADVIGSLERDAFPAIGKLPIQLIEPSHVVDALRSIEARPAVETAHRVRQRLSEVFQYAIACGKCVNDPAATVKGA